MPSLTDFTNQLNKGLRGLAIGIGAVIVIFIVFNLFNFFTIIEPGERGILLRFGEIQTIFEPGLHFKIPFVDRVVKMDILTQKSQVEANAASKDLQAIHTIVALNYHADPASVDKLYSEIGLSYEERVIDPAIQESVKAATAEFTAEELITKRPVVKEKIRQELTSRLTGNHIDIDEFSIVDFSFTEEFDRAIEAKQTAVQQALKAENDLKRIQIEAQQKIEAAKADAESIRIQAEALKQNQGLVQLKMVEKWDGVMPKIMLGNSIPLLNVPLE